MTQGKLTHPLVSEVYVATDQTGAVRGETLMLDLETEPGEKGGDLGAGGVRRQLALFRLAPALAL